MTANKSHSSRYAFTKGRGKTIFIVVSVICHYAIAWTLQLSSISDLTLKSTSSWTLVLFAIIAGISLVGQNLILRFIKQKVDESMHQYRKVSASTQYTN